MKTLVIRYIYWNKEKNEIASKGKNQIQKIIKKIKSLGIEFRIVKPGEFFIFEI